MEDEVVRKALSCILSFIFLLIFLCADLNAATRGIRVSNQQVKDIFLYNDYHAIVVGVGDYTAGWPDLPGALRDSREVASDSPSSRGRRPA